MVVRSMLNYVPKPGEVNTMPSMTVPDQCMSLQEILKRFARGLPVDGGRVPLYDEENDLPDIRTLDLTERAELAAMYKAEIAALTTIPPPSTQKQAELPLNAPENDEVAL